MGGGDKLTKKKKRKEIKDNMLTFKKRRRSTLSLSVVKCTTLACMYSSFDLGAETIIIKVIVMVHFSSLLFLLLISYYLDVLLLFAVISDLRSCTLKKIFFLCPNDCTLSSFFNLSTVSDKRASLY